MLINWFRGIVVVALMGVFGCGKPKETVSNKLAERLVEKALEASEGGKAKVDISGEKITVKSEEGTFSVDMNGASVPDNFPKDVPVPQSGKIISSVSTPKGFMLSIETSVALANAVADFKGGMKSNAWTEESTFSSGEQVIIGFKKEKRAAVLMASANDRKTVLSITTESGD